MRSRLITDNIYRVYTQEQNVQAMTNAALDLWEGQLKTLEPKVRRVKVAKMLNLAGEMPHPQFRAFAEAIAETAEARSSRKNTSRMRPPPVPTPKVLAKETEMDGLIRHLDLMGMILGRLCQDLLKPDNADDARTWLYAQTALTGRMKQAGLARQCDALVQDFAKEGWGADVLRQCIAWLNVGEFDVLVARICAGILESLREQEASENAGKTPAKLTVAQSAELLPTRRLLRLLSVTGLPGLAQVVPDSPQEDAAVRKLKAFENELSEGIANHHVAQSMHEVYAAWEQEGDKIFAETTLTASQKEAARMYCRVIAFVHKQMRAWEKPARECMQAEALARADRRLAKQPKEAASLIARARALVDHRNDPKEALATLDRVPKDKRDNAFVRERAIILAKVGRLTEALAWLDTALGKPSWDDPASLGKMLGLRGEIRLHTQDVMGAWADVKRATLVSPGTPNLPQLSQKVLLAYDAYAEKSFSDALADDPKYHAAHLSLTRAHRLLERERWEDAVKAAQSSHPKTDKLTARAKTIADLSREMAAFVAAANAHKPKETLPEGLTPEMLEMLRQSGWDPSQGGLNSIIEEGSSDED